MADSEEGNSSARESQNAAQGLPRFVCVEFPARVQNVDKMLKTLGGEETISNVSIETNSGAFKKNCLHSLDALSSPTQSLTHVRVIFVNRHFMNSRGVPSFSWQ